MFVLAIHLSVLALGTAIVLGLNDALGALLQIALSHPQQFRTAPGLTLASGVVVMLTGVGLCAWAGIVKESTSEHGRKPYDEGLVRKAVLVAIVAGVLATVFNFALIAWDALRQAAERVGTRSAFISTTQSGATRCLAGLWRTPHIADTCCSGMGAGRTSSSRNRC